MTTQSFTTRITRTVLATALFAVGMATAVAEEVKVTLTGAEETPANASAATGSGTINVAADKSVSGSIKTTGIKGTVAHIHLGAPGLSGPPIITLTKDANGDWVVPTGAKLTDEQYTSFESGNLYVNVHSAEYKPGEIRGQLKP